MELNWYDYPIILIAGFFAGVINMYAGSGSTISLAAMLFAGIPASVANGSNRIAIFLQNIIGVRGYHQKGLLDFNYAWKVAIPGMVGSAVGALGWNYLAETTNEELLRQIVGFIMLGMLVVVFVNPKRLIEGKGGESGHDPTWRDYGLFFLIGIYGGFIQAGIGVFLLLSLVLSSGYDLIRSNAIKVFIVLCQSIIALIIFALNGQVAWGIGLVLAMGNMSGAWVATQFADHPQMAQWAYYLLIGVIIFSGVRFVFFP